MRSDRTDSRTARNRFASVGLARTGSNESRRARSGHSGGTPRVLTTPDGKLLARPSKDHSPRLWDAATGKLLFTLSGHQQSVFSSAFSPDSKYLATAGEDHVIKLWDTATGKQ